MESPEEGRLPDANQGMPINEIALICNEAIL